MRALSNRSLRLATALIVGGALATVPYAAASGVVKGASSSTYINPVSKDFADTFADPSVIKGKDGYWYAFATSDPLREGETEAKKAPISRSSDLVHWSFVGEAFNDANRPTWATPTTSYWAPDVRYINGRYLMYYTATDTNVSDNGFDPAIGVATASSPAGPWTDSGQMLIAPRPGGNNDYLLTIDPALITTPDGRRYLYYGSYYGGIYANEISSDGLRAISDATMVTIDNRYEGSYVVRHRGWYYLFASEANCCAGPTTGYSVFTGRSHNPLGPFLDRDGISMSTSRVGGTAVIQPNGNIWVGTGHNAVVTDLAGRSWFAYHAIDRRDPYLNEPFGVNERPMLLDRLDWIGGWPTVRAGAWASHREVRAPKTRGALYDTFNRTSGIGEQWAPVSGRWRLAADTEGHHARQTLSTSGLGVLLGRTTLPADVRAEADLRTDSANAAGLFVRYQDRTHYAAAWLDRSKHALVTAYRTSSSSGASATRLPADVHIGDWHNLAVQVRGRTMTATVTDLRLSDPYAVLSLKLPASLDHGRVAVASRGGSMGADNVSAARLYRPVTQRKPYPTRGDLAPAFSDEFTGSLDSAWSWVRPDPAAQVTDGVLNWPTEAADLTGSSNNAGVLLRDMPTGDYTVQTRLRLELGVDDIRNYEQAGLIAYDSDDRFARFSHVAIWNTRQTEFGKERPFAGQTVYGGMAIGTPADVTYLRLHHHVDPANGEHEFRAASSRDGMHWTWGGTWTLPAGTTPRVGLVSHGGNQPPATARFGYFRVYTP